MNGNWYYRYELVVKIKWMLGKRVSKCLWCFDDDHDEEKQMMQMIQEYKPQHQDDH